jgi:holo-[acyl-carrier protein] synthase
VIVAVGMDFVELDRLRRVLQAHPKRFLERHFTEAERGYCTAQLDPVPSLGARFAAKEAFQKCWPVALGWRDVWVERHGPKPRLAFAPQLRRALDEGALIAHLSLTHGRGFAAAVVVLERTR